MHTCVRAGDLSLVQAPDEDQVTPPDGCRTAERTPCLSARAGIARVRALPAYAREQATAACVPTMQQSILYINAAFPTGACLWACLQDTGQPPGHRPAFRSAFRSQLWLNVSLQVTGQPSSHRVASRSQASLKVCLRSAFKSHITSLPKGMPPGQGHWCPIGRTGDAGD